MKVTLPEITGGYNIQVINSNFDTLESILNDQVLYRNNPVGEPNQLMTDMDVNGKRLYNLPAPVLASQAARLQDVQAAISGLTPANLIPFSPTVTLSSTNVQGAVEEVEAVARASLLGTGVFSTLAANTGSSLVGFLPSGVGAVAQTVQNKLRQVVSAKDFGCIGNGVADDTAALVLVKNAAILGTPIYFPKGTYRTSLPLNFTQPVSITADVNTRIKLTAAAAYVIQIDLTNGGAFWGYGASLENLILDGGGFCADGLILKGVISSNFTNIRCTNVTVSGLHLTWAQCCLFTNYQCSRNVEAFTTTPANGLLVDGASSSANTFVNIGIEHVSGSGIKALSMINTTFINGTCEGNSIGIEMGEAVPAGPTCIGNTIIGMDLEVNSSCDIVLRATASANSFYGLCSGYLSPAVQVQGSYANSFYGGITSGFDFNGSSHDNTVDGVKLLGSGAIIVNTGTRNVWRNVWNISTAMVIPDGGARARSNNVIGTGGLVSINAAATDFVVLTGTGTTATIDTPTNPADNQTLAVTVHNVSGGALAITWGAGFKIAGWTNPATGFYRSAVFRYDSNYGFWYLTSMPPVDAPN